MKLQLTALLTAILLDTLAGEPPSLIHPVVWMGKWIGFFSRRSFRVPAKSHGRRFAAGAALMIGGLALFCLPLWALSHWIMNLPWLYAGILSGLLLKPVFTLRGLIRAGAEIGSALQSGNLAEARRLTGWHLVSRDTSHLTPAQISSAAVESVAENLTDSFVSPLLFFLAGGLPFAWGYRLVNTADAMIGYHSPKWEWIGKFAARLDDLLNWIPARICGVLICLAAAFTHEEVKKGFQTMFNQHRRFESPNAGWTIAAIAGVLDVRLEKVGCYVANDQGHAPDSADISKANRTITMAAALSVILMAIILILV